MVASDKQGDQRRLRVARFAVIAFFFLNGVTLGTWATRIPAVQAKLSLQPGPLGLALLGSAVGAVVGMNIAGRIAERLGSRLVSTIAGPGLFVALTLLALAPTLPFLALALVLFGAFNGAMDVTMNLQGVDVERGYGRPILNSFHACYSAGSLLGAAFGGILASMNAGLLPHFLMIAIVACVGILVSARFLLPAAPAQSQARAHKQKVVFALPSLTLLLLGLIAFCALLSEGAMSDWSAIYLSGTVHSGAGLAAAGYATFSLFMAFGRGVGDYLAARFGAAMLVRLASLLAGIGLTLALVVAWTPTVLIGLGLVGAGLSVLFPLVLSAAGRSSRQNTGAALATVTTCGYFGLLAGPPLIGFVANGVGLHLALGMVVLLCALAAACAQVADVPTSNDNDPSSINDREAVTPQ